jgi:hypothetical protein
MGRPKRLKGLQLAVCGLQFAVRGRLSGLMVRFPGLSHLRAAVGWDLCDQWEWPERDTFPEP